MPERKTVGLVLGSGASRGWAHIGAIEALEAEHIPIDFIAGCSVGAYVGALYACGALSSLKNYVLKMDGRKVFSYFDVVFPRSGLLNATRKVQELFSMHTETRTFADLRIPVAMVATDLDDGDRVVLNTGELIPALRASMSIPGLFAPARHGDRWLVDGGLVDPVPVSVARVMGADVVIAVDLNSGLVSRRHARTPILAAAEESDRPAAYNSELWHKLTGLYETAEAGIRSTLQDFFNREPAAPDIIETVMAAVAIVQERITRVNLAVEPPDVLIQPRLGNLRMMDFDQVEMAIEEGHRGIREKIDDIRLQLEVKPDDATA